MDGLRVGPPWAAVVALGVGLFIAFWYLSESRPIGRVIVEGSTLLVAPRGRPRLRISLCELETVRLDTVSGFRAVGPRMRKSGRHESAEPVLECAARMLFVVAGAEPFMLPEERVAEAQCQAWFDEVRRWLRDLGWRPTTRPTSSYLPASGAVLPRVDPPRWESVVVPGRHR